MRITGDSDANYWLNENYTQGYISERHEKTENIPSQRFLDYS